MKYLTYTEAKDFAFGGDLYDNGVLTETDNIRALYVGTTLSGEAVARTEPVIEPGVYEETIYMLGGNYLASLIVRVYTINRVEADLKMDGLTVPYDGKAHTIEAYMEDGSELTGEVITLYYGYNTLTNKPPVNAGNYKVYTFYSGDGIHKSGSAVANLTIEKIDAVITVTCKDTVGYCDVTKDDLSAAEIGYTITGAVEGDKHGYISVKPDENKNFPNLGEYTVSARFIQTNYNYNVTVENASFTIVPKLVTVAVNDAKKAIGDTDPTFTYTVTDADGKVLDLVLDLKLAREVGEEIGTYRIFINEFNETNYVLDTEHSTDGVLTITEKPREFILGDVNGDGNVDISDATLLQTYLAEMDCPYDIGETKTKF